MSIVPNTSRILLSVQAVRSQVTRGGSLALSLARRHDVTADVVLRYRSRRRPDNGVRLHLFAAEKGWKAERETKNQPKWELLFYRTISQKVHVTQVLSYLPITNFGQQSSLLALSGIPVCPSRSWLFASMMMGHVDREVVFP